MRSALKSLQDNLITQYDANVQKIMDIAIANEARITHDLNKITKQLNVSLYGLEYSVKEASHVEEKINNNLKKQNAPANALDVMRELNDLVRYTVKSPHGSIAQTTTDVIESLSHNGYDVLKLDNKYITPHPKTGYRGVHVIVAAPAGQTFEVQVHSEESLDAKNKWKTS